MNSKDYHSSSKNIILPPIGSSTLTPSSLRPSDEQSKRTIETEFGTIVVDGKQLIVHSANTNAPTSSTVTITEPDNAPNATIPSVPNLPDSTTEELETTLAFEDSDREENGMWISDCEMMMFTLSAFFGFECAVRVPQLWLQFGGGAFFVAFATCHLVITLPIFLLEAALGQFAGHGVAGFMPQMAPGLRGYPNALLFCLVVRAVSWMTNVSTVSIYVIEALNHRPCWTNCNASFNTNRCYTHTLDQDCQDRGFLLFADHRCVHSEELCQQANSTSLLSPTLANLTKACIHSGNGSPWLNGSVLLGARELSASEYYYNVKHAEDDTHRMHAHGRGILSMLCCWMLVALVSQAGLEFVGFTLPVLLGLPACIAIALMVNELLAERDSSAMWDYLVPNMKDVADYRCWLFAATSSLLTPQIGMGLTSVIYARNPLKHDCQRSALTAIAISFMVNALWTLCCVIMLTRHTIVGKNLKELLLKHRSESFLIILTSSLGAGGDAQVWMGFILLGTLLLALGSSQAAVLVIETCLRELSVLTTMTKRSAVCLICSAGFLLDIAFFVFPSSHDLHVAISRYTYSYYNIVLALVLVCTVNISLGVDRLLDALSQQMAVPLRWSRWFWALCWRCLCPLTLFGMFASTIWHHATQPLRFRGAQLPGWTAVFGVTLTVTPLLFIFVEIFRAYTEVGAGDGEELYRPTERWRVGLHSPDTHAAATGLIGGGGGGGPVAAVSLMTRIYGVVSRRRLLDNGGLARLESKIVPIDTGPCFVVTEPVPADDGPGGLESKAVLTGEGPGGLASKTVPDNQEPGDLESNAVLTGEGPGGLASKTEPDNQEPGDLESKAAPTDGRPGELVPNTTSVDHDPGGVDS